ncbi:hypothetical protein MYX82_11405 [Acidobacteria bacterium AH-259-D05]|nr:hypothetical protein [Acidobacteria bacterium AH-259-D05]
MRRKLACIMFFGGALAPLICGSTYADDTAPKQLPAYYYPAHLVKKEAPDKISGFKKVRQYASTRSAALLTKKMGENYLTNRIAPLVFDSLYQLFVPGKSGDIQLKSTISVVDGTANKLMAKEKENLDKWAKKLFPALPVVGNMLSDVLNSQKLSFSGGKPHYQTRFKKRIAPEYQLGGFSFTGGAETRLVGRDFDGMTLVTTFRYAHEDDSYHVDIYGKRVKFDIKTNWLKADVTWNPRGVKFKVNLTF